jgi:hypothetical protein
MLNKSNRTHTLLKRGYASGLKGKFSYKLNENNFQFCKDSEILEEIYYSEITLIEFIHERSYRGNQIFPFSFCYYLSFITFTFNNFVSSTLPRLDQWY